MTRPAPVHAAVAMTSNDAAGPTGGIITRSVEVMVMMLWGAATSMQLLLPPALLLLLLLLLLCHLVGKRCVQQASPDIQQHRRFVCFDAICLIRNS